jgi:hypothetical protein
MPVERNLNENRNKKMEGWKMIKFYLSDLKEWRAGPDGYEWAESIAQARGRDYIVPEDFENVNWLAWCYSRAACWLPDSRYTPRLIDALINTGDAGRIEWTACFLPDSRYDPRLIDALIETMDAEWLAWAACFLPDSRYDPRLIDALIDIGDAEWLAWATCRLPDARREELNKKLEGGKK